MKTFLSAIALAIAVTAGPAAASDQLPDAMLGSWGEAPSGDAMVYLGDGDGDVIVKRDTYSGVDSDCAILNVEKISRTLYTVRASCEMADHPSTIKTSEFELVGDRLRITAMPEG